MRDLGEAERQLVVEALGLVWDLTSDFSHRDLRAASLGAALAARLASGDLRVIETLLATAQTRSSRLTAALLAALDADPRAPHRQLATRMRAPARAGALTGAAQRVQQLAQVLHDDPRPARRARAAELLGALGRQGLEPLGTGLADSSPEVLRAVLTALRTVHPERALEAAIKRLSTSNRHEPEAVQAGEWLLDLGDEGERRLLAALTAPGPVRLQLRALRVLARRRPERLLAHSSTLDPAQPTNRATIAGWLGVIGIYAWEREPGEHEALRTRCIRRLQPWLRDRDVRVRATTITALASFDAAGWRDDLVPLLRHDSKNVRAAAVRCLAAHGGPDGRPLVEAALRDADPDVRAAALDAVVRLEPARRRELAERMLRDRRSLVVRRALAHLDATGDRRQTVAAALAALPRSRDCGGPALLETILKRAPARRDEALRLAIGSPSPAARAQAAELLLKERDVGPRLVRRLLRDSNGNVRVHAAQRLDVLPDGERSERLLELLRDSHWHVREIAVKLLGRARDPGFLEHLLPMARDEDEDVRQQALKALLPFDDRRVLSELVSSLADTDDDVRELAEKIIAGQHGRPAAMVSLGGEQGFRAWCVAVRATVEAVNGWAAGVGQELLGRPVTVIQYRQGLGRTWRSRGGKRAGAVIEVSDTPVTSGHPHGEQIMRGLALHEIGHNLYDFGRPGFRATNGIARSEGLGEIYDILLDERLERALRSRRPGWGVYFDRLGSYAFAQNEHRIPIADFAGMVGLEVDAAIEALRRGALPGRLQAAAGHAGAAVILRDRDVLRLPGALTPLEAFLYHLRCGFDPREHPDGRIAAAIVLVPDDLKDLEHSELLEVSRRIAKLIGTTKDHRRALERQRRELQRWQQLWRILEGMRQRARDAAQLPGLLAQNSAGGAAGIRQPTASTRVLRRLAPPPADHRHKEAGCQSLNLGPELGFPELRYEQELPHDPEGHRALIVRVRRQVRVLRAHLERLSLSEENEHAARTGHRLDLARARRAVLVPSANLLVRARTVHRTNAYLGILIDRSGSMQGKKIERARAFGALVAESARRIRGITGHINAFDDDTFYRLGGFERNAIASLTAGGGNNDAGALHRAAALALASRKHYMLLMMISDGSPTECTVESLRNLVQVLERQRGITCVQVAVDKMEAVAFPHFVDLSRYGFDEAVSRFGRLLMRLTAGWR